MLGSEEKTPKVEPFITVQLEAGWRFDPESGTFRRSAAQSASEPGEPETSESNKSEIEETFDPSDLLPQSGRFKPMIPSLASASSEALSEWELALASYLHLFPGQGVDLDELVERVKSWDCIETAYRPPEIALP